jgi:glucans biosynthesis protein
MPAELRELDYDAYRSVRFRPDAAIWRDQGDFQLQLFHPGFLYERPVELYVVDDSVRPFAFDPALFTYEGSASAAGAALAERTESADGDPGVAGLGFSGFRVHYPLNDPERLDEFAVFQGASYFRLVGAGQVYGLSARGVAVDVAAAGPEEFPDFTAFWLVRPAPDADTLVFHALLEGPSLTGAYRFVLRPGVDALQGSTQVDVDARLFARSDVGKLGVAPLSSMFFFGPGEPGRFDDFRAAVHDSDGLLAHTRDGEWLWRPLSNRRGLRVSSLRDVNPRGFGLAQRARDFGAYLDLEARYHQRPGAWVSVHPEDRWGGGGVELLEIPTETEYADNIAAYWVPDAPFLAGEERRYRYRVSTFGNRIPAQTLGQVIRTRSGSAGPDAAAVSGSTSAPRRFAVDFAGGILDDLTEDAAVRALVETLSGRVDNVRAERLPDGSGWRASFVVTPDGAGPPDLRLNLAVDGEAVTETWTYVWYPEETR